MAKTKRSLQYVGGSDEETAMLRLLLRKGRSRFQAAWQVQDEDSQPDLLVIDPTTLVGDVALGQARQGGRNFVCIVDADAPDSGDWQLRRPLKLDALVRVFNALTPSDSGPTVLSQGEDFFSADLGEEGSGGLFDADTVSSIPTGSARAGRHPEVHWEEAADALFRRDPDADHIDRVVDIDLGEGTSFERVEGRSGRSERRREDAEERVGRVGGDGGEPRLRSGEAPRDDLRVLPLIDYLKHDILGGPCRTSHGGVHPLVLDPKLRVFHADVDLPELELHCLQHYPVASFEQLTMAQLEALRAHQPARPMVKLEWLYALVNSNGRLASHLDPGGRYWLGRFLELAKDYPHHYQIAAKLSQPRKINELAELTNSRIEDIYNVLNAFDAIGYLEFELRDRLRGIVPPEGEAPAAGADTGQARDADAREDARTERQTHPEEGDPAGN